MLAKAATGSAKNITPKREITVSKLTGSSGSTCASPCRNDAFPRPAASAAARARGSLGPDRARPNPRPGRAERGGARRGPAPAAPHVEHVPAGPQGGSIEDQGGERRVHPV